MSEKLADARASDDEYGVVDPELIATELILAAVTELEADARLRVIKAAFNRLVLERQSNDPQVLELEDEVSSQLGS